MIVYGYRPDTLEYTGPIEADEDQMEPGKFLMPAFTTTVKPPKEKEGNTRVFVDGKWQYTRLEDQTDATDEPQGPTEDEYMVTLMNMADQMAQFRGRANAADMVSYVHSTIPDWSTEALRFVSWRDNLHLAAKEEMNGQQLGDFIMVLSKKVQY